MRDGKRRPRGCCLWFLLAVAFFLALHLYDRHYRQPELWQAFHDALTKKGEVARWGKEYPRLGILPGPGWWEKAEDFAWARSIDGWDRLVIIGPYGHGSEVAWRAARLNPWVFLSVASTDGFLQDSIYTCLVVDNGRVVATLYFDNWPAYYDVVEHDP